MTNEAENMREKLSAVIPPERLDASPETLDQFRAVNPLAPTRSHPALAARPSNAEEVRALVKASLKHGFHLVPVSSAAPHCKGGIACSFAHVVLDLSGWKKIHSIDRRNRVCMVDPGVTYGKLIEALDPHGLTVSVPLAPRAGKSVLAAVMDREPSTWPNKQWDAGDPAGCIEFVFGTGDLFRTGAAGGPGSIEKQRAVGGAQKAPLGPSQTDFHRLLQGAQGCMGVVTWATVRVELKPSLQQPLLAGASELAELSAFVYKVQRSWLGEHSFLLDRTAAALLLCGGDHGNFESIRRSLPAFICLQNIAGFERRGPERLDYQLKDIKDHAADSGVDLVESTGEVSAAQLLEAATRPCGEHDWRHALTGHCLRVFFLTTLDRAPAFIEIMKGLAAQLALPEDRWGVYLQPVVQNHACHVEFMMPFDPDDPAQVNKMRELEAQAVSLLSKAGAFFSRPYGAAERTAFQGNRTNFETLKKIKNIFDPGRTLNPCKFGL